MLQPQSDDEVRAVVAAMRAATNDPALDIVWEPEAIMVAPGSYSALGESVPPTYDGRWRIIRHDTSASLHKERTFTALCYVTETEPTGPRRIPVMKHKGAYAPVGMWLVDYMAMWDRAQRHFADTMDSLWNAHEAIDAPEDDRAANQEAAEKVYRAHGGEYWMGGAQGRAAPETAAALWPGKAGSFGKGYRSTPSP